MADAHPEGRSEGGRPQLLGPGPPWLPRRDGTPRPPGCRSSPPFSCSRSLALTPTRIASSQRSRRFQRRRACCIAISAPTASAAPGNVARIPSPGPFAIDPPRTVTAPVSESCCRRTSSVASSPKRGLHLGGADEIGEQHNADRGLPIMRAVCRAPWGHTRSRRLRGAASSPTDPRAAAPSVSTRSASWSRPIRRRRSASINLLRPV